MNLANVMKEKKMTVWVRDVHAIVGERMDHQVEDAMEESDVVLFILSKSSVDSKALMDEAHTSLNNRKLFLPLFIEPCELPKRLKRIQFIDLHTSRSEGMADLFRALALKGHNFSELHRDVMALLTDGEQKLLAKKELAKSKFEAIERRNRRRRLVVLGMASILVGVLAYVTWDYSKKDRDEFNSIYAEFERYGTRDKDTMNLIEKKFEDHKYNFAYCQHKKPISDVFREYEFSSMDKETEDIPNYTMEIKRLKAVIDSLQLEKIENNKTP